MIIDIRKIRHEDQRYDTVGDWMIVKDWKSSPYDHPREAIMVDSSQLSDPRFVLNIQIHEIIEALLCQQAGITQQQVDEWDMMYEDIRKLGIKAILDVGGTESRFSSSVLLACGCQITATSDPGDDPHAPYHEQHTTASTCEAIIGVHLKIDWARYVKEIEEL